jgi:protein-disulfide isomerase
MHKRVESASFLVLVVAAVVIAVSIAKREFYPSQPTSTGANAAGESTYYPELHRPDIAIELGDSSASVQVVEFLDLQCPACALYHREVVGPFLAASAGRGHVSFAVVHLPLDGHPFAPVAAQAAECAHAQGRFLPFVELALSGQRQFASEPWAAFAKGAGVANAALFAECLGQPEPSARIAAGVELAQTVGLSRTPALAINGWLLPNLPRLEDLTELVEQLASGKSPFPSTP